jgi:hypothetical protein
VVGKHLANSVVLVFGRSQNRVVTEKRMGLEGLPVSDGDVWAFDLLRGGGWSDLTALVVLWCIGLGTALIAVWGGSWILAGTSATVIALALWWTATKLRGRADDRRMMRRVEAEEEQERRAAGGLG